MRDESHLDIFLGQQTDSICLRLVQRFQTISRDANVGSTEYAVKLREAMEELLNELDAPTESLRG